MARCLGNRRIEPWCFSVPRWLRQAKPWLAVFLLFATSACADGGDGRVVAVHDGDTLTVLLRGERVSVRLDEIDAPELGQAHGRESRNALARLCYGRRAAVREQGRDKYGRVLARVECDGIDANAEQVRRGYAWFYRQYGHDPLLRDLETAARGRRVGLWAGAAPVPPWEFRHANAGRGGSGFGSFVDKVFGGGRCGQKKTCGEMKNCEEAKFYLRYCGLKQLDRNRDGVPCESLCR